MASPEDVGKAFVSHYYQTFDTNRDALISLYQDQSMLTWEGQKFSGPQNIVGKFKSLPFQQVQHQVTAMDSQPSMSGGILIQVNGKLMTDGENHALQFSQTFHLMPVNNSFVVTNEVFRLCYG
uniref:NTF2 domain-containing protein n=1 Tax=Tetraselmis chuii TaxID=63592 RepID=A0A7S1T4F2_9CHLO|mmetsp:Transcript_4448/g.8081  ORF Transcript_4448/g.8081 Transcript_4448/m.8081 type:complete len:123 (+) Transcript_4448:172-540(+)|eukprot:CAMPEP_0177776274 /NCGR_PEP_ID=MMETSP0491_2-20121128/14620_1 /TAXON_ID=63592 /ORGANISM="Tetraselmis chuii, Strain PLY429" /LENGTH=122 /DNA_ID=CAMNT_0019295043 /DNA_START=162 /DNA_END=530 /DNA_ORIENTATION=-